MVETSPALRPSKQACWYLSHYPRAARAVYVIVLMAIFSWAIFLRVQFPADPIGDNDTPGSLDPALSSLRGAGFQHEVGTSTVYSGFVLVLLRLFGDVRAISIAQHVLGLVGGVLLLVSWERLRLFYRAPVLPISIHRAIGLILLALYLLPEFRVFYEHRFRPEAVFGFAIIAHLFFFMEFIRLRYVERSGRYVVAGALASITAVMLLLLKGAFAFTALLTFVPVLAPLLDLRESWRRKVLLVAPTLVLMTPLIMIDRHFAEQDRWGKNFLPMTLFTIHADLIAGQIQEDLASHEKVRYDAETLKAVHQLVTQEMAKSRSAGEWSHFGFNPDYMLFEPSSVCGSMIRMFSGSKRMVEFQRYYFGRCWMKRPVAMLRRVGTELNFFYRPGGAFALCKGPLRLGEKYHATVAGFRWNPAEAHASPLGVAYLSRCEALAKIPCNIDDPAPLRIAMELASSAYLPVMAGTLVGAVAILIARRRLSAWSGPAVAVILPYAFSFLICLSVAIVHTLMVHRYIHLQYTATLYGEFAGLLLLAEVAAILIRRLRVRGFFRHVESIE